MVLYLAVMLLALPFIDLYILVETAGVLGFLETLSLIMLTGLIGAFFIRRESETVLRRLGTSVTAKEISRNVLEGSLIVLGGLMLLSPGFITDGLGFLLVFSRTRLRIAMYIERKLEDSASVQVYRADF